MEMSKWVVRRMRDEDKPWVLAQCEAFLGTLPLTIPFNKSRVEQLMASPSIHALIVEKDGVPCGLGAYSIDGHLFNPDISTFTELVWWVLPEYRGSRAGLILLDALDTIAAQYDMAVFSTEASSPVNERVLTRRGYVKQEQSFVKRN